MLLRMQKRGEVFLGDEAQYPVVFTQQWLLQSRDRGKCHVCGCCMMLGDAVDIVKIRCKWSAWGYGASDLRREVGYRPAGRRVSSRQVELHANPAHAAIASVPPPRGAPIQKLLCLLKCTMARCCNRDEFENPKVFPQSSKRHRWAFQWLLQYLLGPVLVAERRRKR